MLERITFHNCSTFDSLVQDYESEFSSITGKKKNDDGFYTLDSSWEEPYEGYYWTKNGKRIGFVIISIENEIADVAEFYVIPSFRNQGIGKIMAHSIFDKYHGRWQVRQIQGADDAKAFWRAVIRSYKSGKYQESTVDDPTWGTVTCQTFDS